jgi:hypothetical protein
MIDVATRDVYVNETQSTVASFKTRQRQTRVCALGGSPRPRGRDKSMAPALGMCRMEKFLYSYN